MSEPITPTNMHERILDLNGDAEINFFRKNPEATTQNIAKFSPQNIIQRAMNNEPISYLEIETLTIPERTILFQSIEQKLAILGWFVHVPSITLDFVKEESDITTEKVKEKSDITITEKYENRTIAHQMRRLESFYYAVQNLIERYDYEHNPDPNKPKRNYRLCFS